MTEADVYMTPDVDRRAPLSIVPSSDVDDLGAQIVAMAGRLAAATCRWLLLVAQFDAREGWRRFGMASTAHWLSYACGIAQRTAIEHARVARALLAQPKLAEEMAAGRLSYSHVRAISRISPVRTGEPTSEPLVEDLVNAAEHSTVRQLESIVRGLRTVSDLEHDDPATPPEEYVTHGWTSRSQWRMSARLDPERGAIVQSAIAAVGRAEGLSQVEALIRLAEIGLAAAADETHQIESPVPERASGKRPRELRGDERAAVVVHIDASAVPTGVDDGTTDPPDSADRPCPPTPAPSAADGSRERPRTPAGWRRPFARIADGPGLSAAVVLRLLCSGRVRTALRDGSNVLDVGRSNRLVNARQWRALLLRDDGCRYPGCGSQRGLEAHHVVHWLYGGRTDMANLLLLCRVHHHAHHDGAFTISGRAPRFRFHLADGTELAHRPDAAADCGPGTTPLEDEYATVAATAATTRWDGRRMEREWVVAGLAERMMGDAERRPGPSPAFDPNFDPWAA